MNTLTNEQSEVVVSALLQVQERQPGVDFISSVAKLQAKLMNEHSLTTRQSLITAMKLLDQQEKQPHIDFLVSKTKLQMEI